MISSSNITFYLSNNAAVKGWTSASSIDLTLGGYISTTAWGNTNFLDTITSYENTFGISNYRCMFVHNSHATDTLKTARVYKTSETAGGFTAYLGVDPIGTTARSYGAAPQAEILASDTATPVTVTSWSAPSTYATGLDLGDIGPYCVRAIWVKRAGKNVAEMLDDEVYFYVGGNNP